MIPTVRPPMALGLVQSWPTELRQGGGTVAVQPDGTVVFNVPSGKSFDFLVANAAFAELRRTADPHSIGLGLGALASDTGGGGNSAFGREALSSNTTGSLNSAFGKFALRDNTTGSWNSALGEFTLLSNTTGSFNSALGRAALLNITTGSRNVAVGTNAGRFIADGVTANATSDSSVYIGTLTKALASGDVNEIVIGHDATGFGSNTAVLGNSAIALTVLRGNIAIGRTATNFKLHASGRTATGAPPTAPTDADLANSELSIWVDEAGSALKFRVKQSDGTLKTGTLTLV